MISFNLVNESNNDIKYRIDKFPDGQQQVVIEPFIIVQRKSNDLFPVTIKSRLNNFRDLELIICATKSLRNLGVKEIHLYTPYFLGSRSDRQFEKGSNNYLRDVICPIINSLGFESVTVLDPHSDVLEACLNNFKKQSNLELVKFALENLYGSVHQNKFLLVSPDAGASKKIHKLAEQIGYKGEIITCSKDRDIDGRLTWVNVPIKKKHLEKDVIIIDDICDGGATFNNISAALNNAEHKGKKYLIVTTGIFSKGFEELSKYFDGIYCTNSYRDIRLNQSINDILGADPKFLKQLNVF